MSSSTESRSATPMTSSPPCPRCRGCTSSRASPAESAASTCSLTAANSWSPRPLCADGRRTRSARAGSATYRGQAMSSQPAAPAAPSERDLAASLGDLSIADASRIRRKLDGVRKLRDPKRRAGSLRRLEQDVAAARLRLVERSAAVPVVTYPPDLPVSKARDELAEAIRDHQVVIVAGETGSGKTTQLPKICLELGRGVKGLIGHTQPRRIAARTVAERIAEELGTDLGRAVGYTVRFTDEVGPTTLVKLMTDGILLAEIQRDRMLTRYDTIIVDEAHERSL